MKKLRERTLWFITTTSIFVVVLVIVVLYNQRVLMIRQEQEIAELNQTIGEHRLNEEWFDDYFDLLEEVYKGKINEAVLEERIYWLERYQEPIVTNEKMYDDFEELIEIIIYYYENTDQVVDLETYVATNYPALHERIMDY